MDGWIEMDSDDLSKWALGIHFSFLILVFLLGNQHEMH